MTLQVNSILVAPSVSVNSITKNTLAKSGKAIIETDIVDL